MLENKASDSRNYQAGSIANLPSYQALSNTVTDAFNARRALKQEIITASENESVRQEALAAEERVEEGWITVATSALVVIGTAVCIVATAGAAAPLFAAIFVAGAATIVYNTSKIEESINSIQLGLAGDGHSVAYNSVRDELFQGNQKNYDAFGNVSTAAFTVLTLGAGAASAASSATSAAASAATSAGTTLSTNAAFMAGARGAAVFGGKVILTAGAAYGGGYATEQVALNYFGASELQARLWGLAGAGAAATLTGFGLNAADKALNLSGTNPTKTNTNTEQRDRILKNIEESKKARESSNFGDYVKNEQTVFDDITNKTSRTNAVEYGEHIEKKGNAKILKPNVEYVDGNGYKYTTDDLGRINNTSGELNLGQGTRNSYAQKTVGGADRLPTDDGGHLIASQFNGSGQIDNLIPQNSGINRAGGEWYNMEKSWSDALKSGSKVEVNINPNYNLNSVRPDSFNVEYWIDGEKFIKFIRNP